MQIGLHAGALSAWFLPHLTADAAAHGAPAPTFEQVRARVLGWREHISTGLQSAGHTTRVLDWDESQDELRVDPLDVDDLRALKLLLAYDDGKGPAPDWLPERPELDTRWVRLAEQAFRDSAYPQLLVPELWFPGEFAFTFVCPLPDGHEVQAGALGGLQSECLALSEQVFGGTPFDWELWSRADSAPADSVQSLRSCARRALARIGRAARAAADRGVPLLTGPLPG